MLILFSFNDFVYIFDALLLLFKLILPPLHVTLGLLSLIFERLLLLLKPRPFLTHPTSLLSDPLLQLFHARDVAIPKGL